MKTPFVFFDFGGTLTAGERSMSSVVRGKEFYEEQRQLFLAPDVYHTLDKTAVVDSLPSFTHAVLDWLKEEQVRRRTHDLEKDSLAMWSEIIGVEGHTLDSPFAHAAEEASVALETYHIGRFIRPEVAETMKRLKEEGYGLGIISNINSRTRVQRELDGYGLSQWFSPVIFSSHIGLRKPHPMVFHHAAALAGVPVSECWHVGDMVSRDVVGARRAGMGGVVYITGSKETVDPILRARWPDSYFEPDAIIDSLTELEEIIGQVAGVEQSGSRKAVIFTPSATQVDPIALTPILESLKAGGWLTAICGHHEVGAVELFNTLEVEGLSTLWDAIQVDSTQPIDSLVELTRRQLNSDLERMVVVASEEEELTHTPTVSVLRVTPAKILSLEEDIHAISVVY